MLCIGVGEFVFDVPLRGSLWLLAPLALIFLFCALAFGMLLSIITKNQLLASQLAIVTTVLPAFLLSGFIFPIENMPLPIQTVTRIVTARYFVTILRGIYLKDVGLAVLWPQALFLVMFRIGGHDGGGAEVQKENTLATEDTESTEENNMDNLTEQIIAAAIEVHRILGPGLLESIYEEALCHEFGIRGIPHERQKEVAVIYKDVRIKGQRLDLLVNGEVVIEIKSVRNMDDVFTAQVLSYLKSTGLKRALLINFGAARLVDGIKRFSL